MTEAGARDSNGQVTPLCEVRSRRAACTRAALRAIASTGHERAIRGVTGVDRVGGDSQRGWRLRETGR